MRTSVRSSLLVRVLGALLAVALLAFPRVAAAADPLEEAKARVTEAIQAADEAVGEHNEAEANFFRLEEQIAKTGRDVDRLRVEQQALAKLAQLRALVAYKGGSGGIEDLVGGDGNVMDTARRATLLDRVNARGNEAIDRLGAVTSDLHAREKALRQDLQDQEDALTLLKERERETHEAVEEARQAEQELRERLEAEQRAAEFAAFVAEARAQARAAAEAAAAAANAANGSDGSDGDNGGAGQIIVRGRWVCPVQGSVSFRNDWGEPRSGGRGHKGTDMFASTGTPTVAVTNGSVFFQSDPLGGNSAYVNGNDGNTYYYAHLDDYVGGARSVKAGELIGHVGHTGNADGGPAHLHFEIRPGGANGAAVNPYPTLAAHC